MADSLIFNRDTRVFIKLSSQDAIWEIPVLDGFSFSQANNTTEVTLSEMDSSSGTRRGRQMFADSFAPAEWSFSTYVRPYNSGSADRSVEEVLWALLAGPAHYQSNQWRTAADGDIYIQQSGDAQEISFAESNKSVLGTADIYFIMGTNNTSAAADTDVVAYKIEGCCVNEATFEYDIEGLATVNWSGFGSVVKDTTATVIANGGSAPGTGSIGDVLIEASAAGGNAALPVITFAAAADWGSSTTPVSTGISNAGFIRNRISSLRVRDTNQTNKLYPVIITGGSVSISNNMTFITPETLGVINTPMGHVTGTRTVTGSFSCYLNGEADGSADLYERLVENTSRITEKFALEFNIGGIAGTDDNTVQFEMPTCHLEIPAHSIEDLVSIETTFHALPSGVDEADEIKVNYSGQTI